MINHGIISAALFLCVGMIYERTHTREIKDYGGVAKVAPVYSTFLALFCLAAAGFPGLNSFIGEFLIIGGAFQTQMWLGVMAIWGVALGTTYLVWLYYRVVMGELNPGLDGAEAGAQCPRNRDAGPVGFPRRVFSASTRIACFPILAKAVDALLTVRGTP